MNHINPIKSMVLVASIGLSLAACGNRKTTDETQAREGHFMSELTEVTDSVTVTKIKAQQILASYLQIKDALVETDTTASQEAAAKMVSFLTEEDDLSLKIKVDAKYIATTNDIAAQRSTFSNLSDNVYTLVKKHLADENTIYRQYCPMAQNNQGAYWLSSEKEILNPYFGGQMLRCGSVKEEI
ncbi:DUF3347 domain-containing protein [Reichenbachiella agarivorans]|uniref:DUF3347 domain-containing protein n=1 Tax=Reichenbachiella agarivorans TaxID=2979464 RepID=A0ABY6CTJ8_9BACT|nr:DUF3347 domain-containing protein [Reichenbachiella agarivorans]UXP33826.1 DUF3347 domain-containing protein [Reichenbachiella agarivorans]